VIKIQSNKSNIVYNLSLYYHLKFTFIIVAATIMITITESYLIIPQYNLLLNFHHVIFITRNSKKIDEKSLQ